MYLDLLVHRMYDGPQASHFTVGVKGEIEAPSSIKIRAIYIYEGVCTSFILFACYPALLFL